MSHFTLPCMSGIAFWREFEGDNDAETKQKEKREG
jgi:hypothetical protein